MCVIFLDSITLHEFARHVNDVENEMDVRGSPGWVSDHDDIDHMNRGGGHGGGKTNGGRYAGHGGRSDSDLGLSHRGRFLTRYYKAERKLRDL